MSPRQGDSSIGSWRFDSSVWLTRRAIAEVISEYKAEEKVERCGRIERGSDLKVVLRPQQRGVYAASTYASTVIPRA